jgi:hypothetical protein
VLFTTETFAMGLNMPARSVVFTTLKKFDGIEPRCVQSSLLEPARPPRRAAARCAALPVAARRRAQGLRLGVGRVQALQHQGLPCRPPTTRARAPAASRTARHHHALTPTATSAAGSTSR